MVMETEPVEGTLTRMTEVGTAMSILHTEHILRQDLKQTGKKEANRESGASGSN